ncbi:MAG: hypothetical protein ACLFVO_05640 [Chloroflexaceae bacterium]
MPQITLEEILANVIDPTRWAVPETLIEVIKIPSLRGMVYGYVAEYEFTRYLRETLNITEYTRDDDHKKTKSDLNFVYNGKRYSVQVKCLQTTLIKQRADGVFKAVAQNDASDRRRVKLPNGEELETTCYVAGEYDILVSTVQPFTGKWQFIFKKNKDLRKSQYRGYTVEQRKYLLATQEPVTYPIDESSGWTYDLLSLLADPELGSTDLTDTTTDTEKITIENPDAEQPIIVEKKKKKRK